MRIPPLILFYLLCWTLYGVSNAREAPSTCPSMPPPLGERLVHLFQAYPEWEWHQGMYCFHWSEHQGQWSLIFSADTIYAPPIPWKGELSAPLAKTLHTLNLLANKEQQISYPKAVWIISALSISSLVFTFVLHGPERYTVQQRLTP